MASEAVLKQKQGIVEEIKNKIDNSTTVVLFDYRGLTDAEIKELRNKLREANADYKVYKNTLMARAFNDLKYDLNDELKGPSAFAFSEDQVAPIKVLAEFAKTHEALTLKVGIIDGEKADLDKLKEFAVLPSRDELLTMLAGGMIGLVRDLSIALNLYAEQKEGDAPAEVKEEPKEEAKEEAVEEKKEESAEETKAEEPAEEEKKEETPVEEPKEEKEESSEEEK
ncbi:MAG: 50S ribosomal protein L10 [Bacilli bacterium]|nr:50S ribosomal protein L10 [Bacilli bacterium]